MPSPIEMPEIQERYDWISVFEDQFPAIYWAMTGFFAVSIWQSLEAELDLHDLINKGE
jgi:hypothetical protein